GGGPRRRGGGRGGALPVRPGRLDGRYDDEVRDGVARFQEWYGVRGDPEGVYGPNTRRALEGATQGGRERR
ncbi:peptidoglycan-binding protein, partial [Streptomyces sp. URMC 125]|uniref:peptidoglycan-binding protein n=1 Tax=Streptomyces sp. URMC 125 TaxID=3423419 RepID=UPI003F1E02E6